ACEWRTTATAERIPRRWVKHLAATVRRAKVIAQVAEAWRRARGIRGLVAGALHQCGWNRQLVADAVGLPRTLIIAEKEQLVLPNRSTNCATELLEAGVG